MILVENILIVEEDNWLHAIVGYSIDLAVKGDAAHDRGQKFILPGWISIERRGHVIHITGIDIGFEHSSTPAKEDVRRLMRSHCHLNLLLVGIVLEIVYNGMHSGMTAVELSVRFIHQRLLAAGANVPDGDGRCAVCSRR
jgi:hypothetical protein